VFRVPSFGLAAFGRLDFGQWAWIWVIGVVGPSPVRLLRGFQYLKSLAFDGRYDDFESGFFIIEDNGNFLFLGIVFEIDDSFCSYQDRPYLVFSASGPAAFYLQRYLLFGRMKTGRTKEQEKRDRQYKKPQPFLHRRYFVLLETRFCVFVIQDGFRVNNKQYIVNVVTMILYQRRCKKLTCFVVRSVPS
jgi:hypothetical protein